MRDYDLKRPYGWMIALLLLAVALVGMRLTYDGLWYDELYSIVNAGGVHFGASTPAGVYERVITDDPYQALGYPNLLALWGTLTGWTAFATRTLSLLALLVGIALTYRLGRDLTRSRFIGVIAALIVTVSAFTIHFAHEVRAFTLVLPFAALTVHAYALLVTRKRAPRSRMIAFVIGAAGLLWVHYYAAMLLIGLGAYHLLFVRKDRRWWQVTGLALIAGVLFLPQIPPFWVALTSYNPAVVSFPMDAPQVMSTLLYYMSNNLALLLLIALAAGLWVAFGRPNPALRLLIGVTIAGVLTLLISNAALEILSAKRFRYAIFLWPLLAVWMAAGMNWIGQRGYRLIAYRNRPLALTLVALLPLLWFANGLRVYAVPDFTESIAGVGALRIPLMTDIVREQGTPDDLFALFNGTSSDAWYQRLSLEYATSGLETPSLFTASFYDGNPQIESWANQNLNRSQRVWYGVNQQMPDMTLHAQFQDDLAAAGFVLCADLLNLDDLSFALYARSEAYCPAEAPVLTAGEDFTLGGYQWQHENDTLLLNLGWWLANDLPSDRYALALHVSPVDAPLTVSAQGDRAFPAQSFVGFDVAIDTGALPAGEYDLWLSVYDVLNGQREIITRADGTTTDRARLFSLTLE